MKIKWHQISHILASKLLTYYIAEDLVNVWIVVIHKTANWYTYYSSNISNYKRLTVKITLIERDSKFWCKYTSAISRKVMFEILIYQYRIEQFI